MSCRSDTWDSYCNWDCFCILCFKHMLNATQRMCNCPIWTLTCTGDKFQTHTGFISLDWYGKLIADCALDSILLSNREETTFLLL